jgi:class 3 adenylate cyclase/tetratricopeptide (TPR) repeat protein
VFCDVTGSTSLGERLDPEALREILQRYFTELKTILERHGGTVEKFIGDAVMAVFGVPVLHEDDAIRAVRAAAEMGEAIDRLNADAPDGGVAIAVRTGVNTGEVVAGDSASGHGFVTGDAVNVAARLEQAASPGEILIGDQTYSLVQDAVRCEPVASLELKGKSEPVPVFRLLEVFPRAPGHARRLDSPMVGREAELAQLQEAYASAREGRACVTLTVVGEAGVGKSRLVQEFLGRSAEEALVLQVRCLPYGEGITFWPVAEAVRTAAAITEDDSSESAQEKIGALLGSLEDAPLIRERVAGAVGLAEAPGDIRETFWAIRRFLEALARDRPVILAVDDLHWGEPTFLDLLQYVASFTRDQALFLLGIARPELLEDRADWAEVGALVHLSPLSEEQSDRLIAGLLDSGDLPGELRGRIVAAAQGTPLFVEEMIRKLLDERLLSRHDGQWVLRGDPSGVSVPLTIQALLGARLDRLEEEERVLLQRASVVGEEFWWGAVAELTPEDSRPTVGARLNTLLRKELILPGTSSFGGEDAFRFSHLLVRDVAYESVPKALRADYHEVFTGWLERAAAERLPEYEEILGYHLERAFRFRTELGFDNDATRTLAARASGRLIAGGRRALGRGDVKAAANLLERAAMLMPQTDRPTILADLAYAQRESGDLRRAEVSLLEALRTAEETGDEAAATRAQLDLVLLRLMMGSSHDFAGALREAEAALEVFERLGNERGRAHAWHAIGQLRFWTGFSATAESAFQKSAHHAREVGDQQLLADSFIWLCGAMLWGPTPVPETILRLEDIRRESEAMVLELALLNLLGVARAMLGSFEEAREILQQGASGMEELGLRLELAAQGQFWAEVELLADNPEGALERLGPGTEELRRMGEKGYFSTNAAWLAEANYRLGSYEEAEALTIESEATAAPDDVESQYRWRCVRAKVLAVRGSLEEAESMAREAMRLAMGTDNPNRHGDALMELAEVLRLAGRPGEAVPFVKQAIALFEQKGNIVSAEKARGALAGLDSGEQA